MLQDWLRNMSKTKHNDCKADELLINEFKKTCWKAEPHGQTDMKDRI